MTLPYIQFDYHEDRSFW